MKFYSNKNLIAIKNRCGYIISSFTNETNTSCYLIYNIKKNTEYKITLEGKSIINNEAYLWTGTEDMKTISCDLIDKTFFEKKINSEKINKICIGILFKNSTKRCRFFVKKITLLNSNTNKLINYFKKPDKKDIPVKKNNDINKLYVIKKKIFKKEIKKEIKKKTIIKRVPNKIINIKNKFIIFIPYCNVYKNYILECLNSIIEQKYENYRIVLIMDGPKKNIELIKYIRDKINISVISYKKNNGPGYTKWFFIQTLLISEYNDNDISLFLDGDDYLLPNTLDKINNKYNNTKCWCTFGNAEGLFCKTSLNKANKLWNNYDIKNIRKNEWFFNHPRTFKLFLLKKLKGNNFTYKNDWLKKYTDRQLIYNTYEMSGKDKIQYIKDILYHYREHDLNSHKTVNDAYKKEVLEYLNTLKPVEKIEEDIHIVMCCWKRVKNLRKQIKNLNKQTFNKRIHLHLLNNNQEKEEITKIVNKCKELYKLKISLSHYENKYYGFQRFLYIKDVLLKKYILDYVIIIDDDQLFDNKWVENIWNLRKPKTYCGWYCKKWSKWKELNYWNGTLINSYECRDNKKENIKGCQYIGTAGSIIDVNIFNNNSIIWNIPTDLPKGVSIYNIEDLWLSYICFQYNYKLERSFLPEIKNLTEKHLNINKSLSSSLKKEKQLLFLYLIGKKWFL